MQKSFYHYIVQFRFNLVSNVWSEVADSIYNDHSFPKQSRDFHELSVYLEEYADYVPSMLIFEEMWESYNLNCK
ncbi:MAG: hypothetical protein K0S51_1774 [Bacillales bacterium]|nr:hypothetical protein [Bacillales bacterium]